jgi:hypothetical protein
MIFKRAKADIIHSGVVCSLLRFRYVDGLTQIEDFFWAAVQIATWSTIECGASIIAGCLATLRPLLRHIAPTSRNTTTLGSGSPQVSRSFGYSARSNTLPHLNSASSTKAGSSRNKSISQNMDESTMMEFLALPGRAVIALSGKGDGRTSTDPIIAQQLAEERISFSWPTLTRNKSKRQTMHAISTLEDGVAGDGRTSEWQVSKEY